MMADKIRNRISEMCTFFGFDYKGKRGGVDPCYLPDTKQDVFYMFYGDENVDVYSIDEVMNNPIFDGKSLADICDDPAFNIDEW